MEDIVWKKTHRCTSYHAFVTIAGKPTYSRCNLRTFGQWHEYSPVRGGRAVEFKKCKSCLKSLEKLMANMKKEILLSADFAALLVDLVIVVEREASGASLVANAVLVKHEDCIEGLLKVGLIKEF